MLRRTVGAAAVCVAVLALAPAAKADDARTARLRLLCAQISGDLTDPGGLAQFRRCMNSADPVAAMRQNALPPRHPIRGLVAKTGVALTSNGASSGAAGCGHVLVWRGATPGDRRCVSRQVHAAIQTAGLMAAFGAMYLGMRLLSRKWSKAPYWPAMYQDRAKLPAEHDYEI